MAPACSCAASTWTWWPTYASGEPAGFKYRDGELAFVTPPRAHEGAADVELRTRDGASTVLKNAFTYSPVPPPAIRSLAPNRGGPSGGTEVTTSPARTSRRGRASSWTESAWPSPRCATRRPSCSRLPPARPARWPTWPCAARRGQQAVVKRAFLYDLAVRVSPSGVRSPSP